MFSLLETSDNGRHDHPHETRPDEQAHPWNNPLVDCLYCFCFNVLHLHGSFIPKMQPCADSNLDKSVFMLKFATLLDDCFKFLLSASELK